MTDRYLGHAGNIEVSKSDRVAVTLTVAGALGYLISRTPVLPERHREYVRAFSIAGVALGGSKLAADNFAARYQPKA